MASFFTAYSQASYTVTCSIFVATKVAHSILTVIEDEVVRCSPYQYFKGGHSYPKTTTRWSALPARSHLASLTDKKCTASYTPFFLTSLYHALPVLLVNSANSTLTDPGQVCPGNTVRLICDVTTAAVQTWFYWNERVAQVANASSGPIISPLPLQPIQGVIFDISVLSTNPYLVTQLSFVASNTMEGGNVTCRTVLSDTSLLPVNNEVLLQVENIGN